MLSLYLVYGIFLSIALVAILGFLLRGNPPPNRQLSRVRVRNEDPLRGRQIPEQPDDEFELGITQKFWLIGALLVLLLFLIGKI